MEFDLSQVEMSKSDVRRGVKLPDRLSTQLAEFIGIMVGDGHLTVYSEKDRIGSVRRSIEITANANEKDYIKYLSELFYSLFNLKLIYKPDHRSCAVVLVANSKGLVEFVSKICEVPVNRKSHIVRVPDLIKSGKIGFQYAFLRGLADTDFSMTFRNRPNKGHIYPVIKGTFCSKRLIQDLEEIFTGLGFKYCVYYNEIRYDKRFAPTTSHNIYLNGVENFKKWVNLIGFSNQKFNHKVEKWQRDGECPPNKNEASAGIRTPDLLMA